MKPLDLQLGVIDLFSVMLPGAGLAAYLYKEKLVRDVELVEYLSAQSSEAVRWAAFVLVAYALGHMVFMFAAQLDRLYDLYRQRVWPDKDGTAFRTADSLRKDRLAAVDAVPSMNTFSWAKALLLLEDPAAASVVERYEADSKFFRSMVVLFLVLGMSIGYRNGSHGVALCGLAAAAFVRYAERRYKSTEWAYRFVITFFSLRASAEVSAEPEDGLK